MTELQLDSEDYAIEAIRNALAPHGYYVGSSSGRDVLDALCSLPVEQRMEAMGMVESFPFAVNHHALHCDSKVGRPCDCTVNVARYWREEV